MSLLKRFLRRPPQPNRTDLPEAAVPAPAAAEPPRRPPTPQPAKPQQVREIVLSIDHDVAPQADRVVALMQSAASRHFTSAPVRPNAARAVAELRDLLTGTNIVAGTLHARADTQELGLCGFYLVRLAENDRKLLHFCFSDELAGTGVETWLYRRLGSPAIDLRSELASELVREAPSPADIVLEAQKVPPPALTGPICVRGSSDLRPVLHYFALHGHDVRSDSNIGHNGGPLPLHHSIVARYAIDGMDPAVADALAPLGFAPPDFQTVLTAQDARGKAIWLLSPWSDAQLPLCRHRSTGALVPARMGKPPAAGDTENEAAARRIYLKRNFVPEGAIEELPFKENLHALLKLAGDETRIFLLTLVETPRHAGADAANERRRLINDWTAAVASEYRNATLLRMSDYVASPDEIGRANHFDRMVYVRLFRDLAARCTTPAAAPI
jgi:hypothetical protein